MSYLLALFSFGTGILLGAWLFSNTRPRSLLNIKTPHHYVASNEAAGLLASVLVQKTPALIPKVILETDKTIVFEHPRPKHKTHYIFMPKKDIKNIGELGEEDKEHIIDLFSAIVSQINKLQLHNYRVWTNGPGKQDVTYLHFHLAAE